MIYALKQVVGVPAATDQEISHSLAILARIRGQFSPENWQRITAAIGSHKIVFVGDREAFQRHDDHNPHPKFLCLFCGEPVVTASDKSNCPERRDADYDFYFKHKPQKNCEGTIREDLKNNCCHALCGRFNHEDYIIEKCNCQGYCHIENPHGCHDFYWELRR